MPNFLEIARKVMQAVGRSFVRAGALTSESSSLLISKGCVVSAV